MSDFNNESKKAPWTQDPEIVKAVWGANAQVSLKSTTTASDRLVNQKGSLWPTENELQAYMNNSMPEPQSFTTKPIEQTTVAIKPMHSTPILNPLDSTQSLIDSVLGSRTKAMDTTARVSLFLNEDDVAGSKRQDLQDFGPDDGRNNIDEGSIDDLDFLTGGYDIDNQYVSDNDGDAYMDDQVGKTAKEKIPSAKRKKLDDGDFVLPGERKFPVTTPKGVMQAVNSWGRYEGETGFATFKKNLIALAKRKGFTKSLPQKWQEEMKSEKSFEDKEITITIEDTPLSKRLKEVASKMQNIMQKS